MAWVYAMYKGDECLAIGTKKEICKQMNISIKTLNYYRTKAYQERLENRKEKNARRVIRIDEEEWQ